jgi:hypothetical protein
MKTRLTERDITRIVRRVVNEQNEFDSPPPEGKILVKDKDGKERYVTSNTKQEYIDEIKSLLDMMENSDEHNADTVAQIIVNNSNFFLTRQKQWSDKTKYGEPLFTDSEVKYLDKD